MKRNWSTWLKVALVVVLIVVAIVAALFIKNWFESKTPVIEEKNEIDITTIEESIRTIAELATLSHNYTDVCAFSEQKTMTLFGVEFTLPGTTKSFIICYDGEMKIGVDASQISVRADDGHITLTLPKAKVLSHVIKEDSVKLLDEKSGLFNPISVTDYTGFITEQKQSMEDKALSSGLFTQAQDNAEAQIRGLLLLLPGIAEEYEVDFLIGPND
jgi:hypothetical protein